MTNTWTQTDYQEVRMTAANVNEIIAAVNQRCAAAGIAGLDLVVTEDSCMAAVWAAIQAKIDELAEYFLVAHDGGTPRAATYYDDESVHALEFYTAGTLRTAIGYAAGWPRFTDHISKDNATPNASGYCTSEDICDQLIPEAICAALNRLVWTHADATWQGTSISDNGGAGSVSNQGTAEVAWTEATFWADWGWPSAPVSARDGLGRYSSGQIWFEGGQYWTWAADAYLSNRRDKAVVTIAAGLPTRTIRWRMKGAAPNVEFPQNSTTFDGNGDLTAESTMQVTKFDSGDPAVDPANGDTNPVSSQLLGQPGEPTWVGEPTADAGFDEKGYVVSGNPDCILQWDF